MPTLVHRSGPQRGLSFAFERNVQIGRGPLADLQVQDFAVSHRHALITIAEGRCYVSDLQSGNGTFLNGSRLTSREPLNVGDEIRIGSTALELVSSGERKREEWATSRVFIRDIDPRASTGSVVISLSDVQAKSSRGVAERLTQLERRLAFFHEAGRSLTKTLDEGELLAELLEQTMKILPQADRAFVVLYDEATGSFTPCAARTRSGSVGEIPASRTLLEEAVRRREAIASIDAGAESGFKDAASILMLDLRAVACVPLLLEKRVLGVLQLDNVQQKSGFSVSDLDLLAGIAGPIALAIEHARVHRRLVEREILEHDLELARRIQQSFLPQSVPEVSGWRVAVEYAPMLEVGGDLYDLMPLADGRLGLALGDVSGKGVSGALLMARLTSALRVAAARSPYPSDVLEELNERLHAEAAEGMFVTLAYGTLDFASGRVEMASAGHPPPLLRHANGRCGEMRLAGGSALGVRKRLDAQTFGWEMQRGDLLVLYSDGLSEAMSPAGEQFEVQRLIETLRTTTGEAAKALEALLKGARAFVAQRGFDDDVTAVCVSRD